MEIEGKRIKVTISTRDVYWQAWVVEDIVAHVAPLANWIFQGFLTARSGSGIEVAAYCLTEDNLFFLPLESNDNTDDIQLRVAFRDGDLSVSEQLNLAALFFLERLIGELRFRGLIDRVEFARYEVGEEWISVSKLRAYLDWREGDMTSEVGMEDFVEDNFIAFHGVVQSKPIIALFNVGLLRWSGKTTYPYLIQVTFSFDGTEFLGMPSPQTLREIEQLEKGFEEFAKEVFYIGRTTGNGERTLYFAASEFMESARQLYELLSCVKGERGFEIEVEMTRDKYWEVLEPFSELH